MRISDWSSDVCSSDLALASLRGERLLRSIEGLQAGLSATQDEGVDIMSTLIGVDDLEVAHMAHHRKRVGYTVSAMHITRLSCDTESFSRTVALYDGNHFRRRAALVQQPPDPKASLEPKRDLDLQIGRAHV